MQLDKWDLELERKVAQQLAASAIPFVGDGSRPVWSIDTPPPYPSGKWHIGAVAGYSLIDMIARSKRMEGYDVLFPWGVDRNGINIEFTVEKKHKKRMQDWDRAAFNEACRQEISVYSDEMIRIGQRVGLSCDYRRPYETDSPAYRGFSQAMFLDLFARGLIVEDLRPNNYDPKLGTTIADADVYYEERKTRLNHVVWTVRETGEQLVVSTTRPELICAARAVLVHPDNEATKHLIGKTAVLPLERGAGLPQEVPIRAHTHVKTDFGSGVMMVCSYGDQADVQLFRELQLEAIAAIGLDGRMTDAAGAYAGLKVEEARQKVIADLEESGKMEGHQVVDQKFPISERSKAAVEIVSLKEWYVKQTHCVDALRQRAHEMRFIPSKHRQLLLDWIDTVTIDWPISRRRYYHTEIPLWFLAPRDADVADAPYIVVPPFDVTATEHPYHRPWTEEPPAGSKVYDRQSRAELGPLDAFREQHPELRLVGETKVFDTWMDSSVSNLYILKDWRHTDWGRDFVCSVRPQGRDIVRTWLYYTTLKTHLLRDEPAFQNAWIHGMGMDKHGRKMSKSVGNVIEADEVIEKFGSDAFRLWIAGECTIGDDFRINPEKIQGTAKFLTKLANVVRFTTGFPDAPRPERLEPADEWILGELDAVTEAAVAGYRDIDFFTPANAVRGFVWNLFAPHYVELVKGRAYAGDAAACWTLHEVVRRVLHLLAPICPFIAHYLASTVYATDVHRARFPAPLGVARRAQLTDLIVNFNSEVWKAKKDQGLSLAAAVSGIAVPSELEPVKPELVAMHKLE